MVVLFWEVPDNDFLRCFSIWSSFWVYRDGSVLNYFDYGLRLILCARSKVYKRSRESRPYSTFF